MGSQLVMHTLLLLRNIFFLDDSRVCMSCFRLFKFVLFILDNTPIFCVYFMKKSLSTLKIPLKIKYCGNPNSGIDIVDSLASLSQWHTFEWLLYY